MVLQNTPIIYTHPVLRTLDCLTSYYVASYNGFWARSQNYENRLLALSCLSVCPQVKTRLPLHGLSWNLISEHFSKICRDITVSSHLANSPHLQPHTILNWNAFVWRLLKMGKWCPKHVEALNVNKSESKSKVRIKLVVFITLLWCTVSKTLNVEKI
jgi:hypothetical protein